MKRVVVSGSYDDLRSPGMRFLQEASRIGKVRVLLWNDEMVERVTGAPPAFPLPERRYMVESMKAVDDVTILDAVFDPDTLPEEFAAGIDLWADTGSARNEGRLAFCGPRGIEYKVFSDDELSGFPDEEPPAKAGGKSVLVTGCFDWFHSGHIRFFEEISDLGRLYVVVGNDENVRLLKGEGHPMFSEQERRYICGSVGFVYQALIATGSGWLDAEPEIRRIKPDMYAVNEDGDKPEKRRFCKENGIEYVVLKRIPKDGLKRRTSTNLRGF